MISCPGDWRHGADAAAVERRLSEDGAHTIKAVMVVHNETSTGVTSRIARDPQGASTSAAHPALFMVDTISSLASIDYRHDEWGVDVTVACSQKGLMLPPGLGFNAVSEKALAASKSAACRVRTGTGTEMLKPNAIGFFPYTPSTNLLYGLREAIAMLLEEGLEQVFARHDRHAEATRAAVEGWGLEVLALDPAEYSSSLTAVLMPAGHDADELPRGDAGEIRYLARHRTWQAERQGFPYRPSRRLQRSDAGGLARRRGDGAAGSRGSAPRWRRAGGDGSAGEGRDFRISAGHEQCALAAIPRTVPDALEARWRLLFLWREPVPDLYVLRLKLHSGAVRLELEQGRKVLFGMARAL